jgi:quercetin dioxygenase-like cupin family protein
MKKTLLEVAMEAGLSVGFLSQVERNLAGISISSLINVAKALNVPLRVLFDQPLQTAPDSHKNKRKTYSIVETQQKYERLSTSFPGSVINAVKMELPVGYCSEFVSHDGDEFVYIMSGHARYTIAGKEYQLSGGDSVHFDAHQSHSLANIGDTVVELISVGTLAIFDDPPVA